MRLLIATVLAVSALVAAGCNSPNIPPGNYGIVSGLVTSSKGQPVAGVVVQADYGPSSPPTGPDGRYTINTVPISSAASGTTISILPSSVPSGYGVPPAQNIQVIAGQTTPNVNFVLSPG
ncbi:MAG: hypothetical protein JOZ91_09945 [Candidatus Eremiobacteraeota bacterium]|nr:hypothetical protein [Candidatus Eremiobacteraeota bacterium]MBV8263441.1 hypothetical protein [Candidatus Eremiobacteraeota bacterium]MBV8339267.1 hypothetical protein [Candidatus Eremiobacteraeota bacterium]MBV8459889.1 hypothetical protein [Candidatus Eremiobacteraeota bacterium]MBV8594890.1 hypothetical protein [Candidatus Eremiobacteraeota bacterium]